MNLVAVFVTIAWIAAVAFPILYARSTGWKMPVTAPGRSLMLLSLVIAVTLTLTELRIFGERPPHWTSTVLWGAIAVALWAQLVTLFVVQYRRRRQDQKREDAPR